MVRNANYLGMTMKTFIDRTYTAPGLMLALSLLTSPVHADGSSRESGIPLPDVLTGTWQVDAVHIDSGATRALRYQHNDPRLKGRIFTISHEVLAANTPEEPTCEMPTIAARLSDIGKLVQNSMAGRGSRPITPTASDYGLDKQIRAASEAFTVRCKNGLWGGGMGREGGIEGAWITHFGHDKLAIRWYDETILELHRVPLGAKPTPSFHCTMAGNNTEKTICGSLALASLDASVAASYTDATKRFTELDDRQALGRLKAEQRAWLAERNKCGANVKCLQDAMSQRLERIETMERDEAKE